ncbi:MAG: YIP1 family protein [Deltaproteobacteria bacterium]|nr:YIP1 family protein [Deltaproteobacteria bacterium]
MGQQIEKNITAILNTMVEVIRNPVGFFRRMPKSGGFVEPLIFMACMGVAAGVIQAILAIFGLGFAGSFLMALTSIIIVPIMVTIFGFVGAAILFVIWKIMGSQQSFETAYRCGAYAGGIVPVTTVLGIIPYLGPILGLVWGTYLIVIASVEVHNIAAKTAWIVFGAIAALFALISIGSQFAARRVTSGLNKWEQEMGKTGEMTPEEAGKAMGEFLKGLEKEVGKE